MPPPPTSTPIKYATNMLLYQLSFTGKASPRNKTKIDYEVTGIQTTASTQLIIINQNLQISIQ